MGFTIWKGVDEGGEEQDLGEDGGKESQWKGP